MGNQDRNVSGQSIFLERDATLTANAIQSAIARAQASSPFLREAIARQPELIAILIDRGVVAASAHVHHDPNDDVGTRLRHDRAALSLLVALTDLAGLASLEDTVSSLSDFADRVLGRAIGEAMRERCGADAPVGFTAIAMGKQGSRELNYSSDIDPIFLYDPETLPRRAREDHGQGAVRIARRVVDLLQTRTAAGHVLRVDLRLRPSPEVTPIAMPVEAAIAYYETSALPWERAAFIRARAAAGDLDLGRRFLATIQPFVWRRSLDFGAVAEITTLSRQIREQSEDSRVFGEGYDLKRGRGGIREIEFYAQVHQLIHGGRDPSLRVPATLDALAALARAGRLAPRVAGELADAYRMLRTIEHRLQMIDDRQTHSLPHGDALDAVARLHGLIDGSALLALLAPHVARVGTLYDALMGEAEPVARLPEPRDALETALTAAGFAAPGPAAERIGGWRQGHARSLRSPAARTAFETMLPGLIEAVGRVPDPNAALNRFDDIVARLPSGMNLYRLLEARPALVGLVAQILGHAPALADQLARRPELLDGLIDASILDPAPDVEALAGQFAAAAATKSYEAALDAVRRRVNEWRFALGVQLISGRADPLDLSAAYARVAQAALETLAGITVRAFAAVHGNVPGAELVVIGLGRLGGEALTHASDLDLVYVFTGEVDAASDGPRPLRATDYFNRLARRVTAALGTPTAAGPLYDVDTRLRPSGVHGMLAVSLDAFATYQRDGAWTFEHMALTRARTVYGSVGARAAVEARIRAILLQPRDGARTLADAVAIRADMTRHKPPAGPFDVKLDAGGLVDLEFAIHMRQLIGGVGLHPQLGRAIDALHRAGQLPSPVVDAYRLLARMLVTLRLVAPGGIAPAVASQLLIASVCGQPDWHALVAALAEARQAVTAYWQDSSKVAAC